MHRVGLFVTCLVDLMRPKVGFAAIKLLEQAGCQVTVPTQQTCCGQPAYNSGDDKDTRSIAKQVIDTFSDFDYVVAPSGSCAGMIREHYPQLFAEDPDMVLKAHRLAARTYELTSFLTDVCQFEQVDAAFTAKLAYHDSCAGLRELNIKKQPRQLLQQVKGCEIKELGDNEACCGFGGTFCVKYPEISNQMVSRKVQAIEDAGAECLAAGDLGCLMNMAGKLKRLNKPIKVYHTAEILAGMADKAIGEDDNESH